MNIEPPSDGGRNPDRSSNGSRSRRVVTETVGRLQETIASARASMDAVDIAVTAFERDGRIGGFLLAGAIAFRCFVYLLPLYLLALVAAGAAVSYDPRSPAEIAGSAGLSRYVAGMIGDAAETSKRSLWILAPLTLWALFSAGRSVHKVLATSHANAWGILPPRGSKPHLVAAAVFAFSLAILGGIITGRFLHTGLLAPAGAIVAASYYFAIWIAASHLLPHPAGVSTRSLVPGAILVAVGTQALYLFNVLYLNQRIESASEAYGALGIAASLLLWLYLLGRLMVAAPVLNATLWQRSVDGDADADEVEPGA